jgi:hypothetical protein
VLFTSATPEQRQTALIFILQVFANLPVSLRAQALAFGILKCFSLEGCWKELTRDLRLVYSG